VTVAVVLLVLAMVVLACLAGGHSSPEHLRPFPGTGVHGVLQAAGLLFFAFAGYARIATLGEEVRDPARTIRRAIPLALAITLVVYTAVGIATLLAVGPVRLAVSGSPLRTAVAAGSWHALAPLVQVGGAVAALGALLSLVLGVSRTTFAMARDGYLPRPLAAVPARGVPVYAEVAVGVVVVVLVAAVDLRGAIGFSSFGVLLYYAIANASAWTLRDDELRPPRWVPAVGLLGCVTLAANLPANSVLAGAIVTALGVAVYHVGRLRPAFRRKSSPR
jgi:APA family basic amino acid/polyamine antiporter